MIFLFIIFFFNGRVRAGRVWEAQGSAEAGAAGEGSAGSPPPAAPGQRRGKFQFSTDLVQTNKVYTPPKKLFKENMVRKSKSLLNWGAASHLPGKALCFLGF